jgi:hypothetical protein
MICSLHDDSPSRLARWRRWVLCLVGMVGACAAQPTGPTGPTGSSTAAPTCAPCVCQCEPTPSVASQGSDVDTDLDDVGLARRLAELERKEKAGELLASAQAKMNRGDAKGCLGDLDAAAKLDARHETSMTMLRAQCTMRAGECERGKRLAREWYTNQMRHQLGPEQIEAAVEGLARVNCQGKMSDRDALLKALMELQQGAYMSKKDVSFCTSRYETIMRLRSKVRPKNGEDHEILTLRDRPEIAGYTLSACYGRAGDCRKAREAYDRVMAPHFAAIVDRAQKDELLRNGFESMVRSCKKV